MGAPLQASTTVRVFPDKNGWRALYFTPEELANPALEATLWGVQITRNLGPLHLMGKTYKYFLYSNVYIIKN